MTRTIYIAGKVTGTDRVACAHKFATAEHQLQQQGHQTLNPLRLVGSWDTPWPQAMRICIAALATATEAYFLADWQHSRGARLEHQICLAIGIPIHYQNPPQT
ncbi:MAG: DUF4406 domain-containing protein [Weeksellaceae bacterium]|nr:DUF4406 domain-containing protein [Weeksellaceae bacterium]